MLTRDKNSLPDSIHVGPYNAVTTRALLACLEKQCSRKRGQPLKKT